MSYFGPATKLFFLQVMWWNCSGDWIYIFFASRHSSKHVSCSHTHTITTKREFYLALISSDLPSLLLREISLLFSKLFSLVLGSLIVMHMFDYMDSRHRDHSSQSPRVLLIEVDCTTFSLLNPCYIFLSSPAVICPAMSVDSEGLFVSPPACGNVNSNGSLGYATECRFTCKSGYQLLGPRLKTCTESKKWFPIGSPSCRGMCQS